MGILSTLRFIVRHPLNRGAAAKAVLRWARWQLGSRMLPGPVLLPFVNEARLLVRPGMTGATGNLYCGLHEYEDMAFVLHALRPTDLFVDIGANVGSYTILAGAAAGARVISVEPIPSTFESLRQNIAINGLGERVRALNLGVGRSQGTLRFTRGWDTTNHVVTAAEDVPDPVEVAVAPLDALLAGERPTLIKIDVEGFESEVLAGAGKTLAARDLLALIVELNGNGTRYGFDDETLHRGLLAQGFEAFRYRPLERVLEPLGGMRSGAGNTLYCREVDRIAERVHTAPRFRLGNGAEV